MEDRVMNTKEVSEYIGVAVSTLAMYRALGTGPQYMKIRSRLVRYRKAAVDEWLDAQKQLPEDMSDIAQFVPNPYSA